MGNHTRALCASVLFVVLAAIGARAIAGTTSTEAPTVYMILLADDTIEKGKEWPKTLDECVKRAQAIIPAGSCSIRRKFTNVGTCVDVPKPKWLRELDADGFVIKPGIRGKLKAGSDSDYDFEVEDYVAAPYPDCWVKGWRVAMAKDFNDESQSEVAGVMEPTWHTPEEKAKLDAFNVEWQASKDAAAAACAAGDATQCPRLPLNTPGACGWYWETACGGPGVPPA